MLQRMIWVAGGILRDHNGLMLAAYVTRHNLRLIPTWLNSMLYFLEFLYVCADADVSCDFRR